jgi:hypothetical protein
MSLWWAPPLRRLPVQPLLRAIGLALCSAAAAVPAGAHAPAADALPTGKAAQVNEVRLPTRGSGPRNNHSVHSTSPPESSAATDLDALMAEVLKRRDDTWRRLGDYVLDERERVEIVGPDRAVLYSLRREFTWYSRDGILVRSPVKVDGVVIGEEDRRRYEERWLREQREHADRHRTRSARSPAGSEEAGGRQPERDPDEPRFISEAHFFRFRFSPGNYYLAGRDTVDGRETLRIEYYPTRLAGDDQRRARRRARRSPDRDAELEDRIARQVAKVTLVTLWVDPEVPQIVKFTFDNVDFDFLPLRWLVRLDDARASMTMGQPFEGVWLPQTITMDGAATLATGTLRVRYLREFLDYRLAEVTTRWRVQ